MLDFEAGEVVREGHLSMLECLFIWRTYDTFYLSFGPELSCGMGSPLQIPTYRGQAPCLNVYHGSWQPVVRIVQRFVSSLWYVHNFQHV